MVAINATVAYLEDEWYKKLMETDIQPLYAMIKSDREVFGFVSEKYVSTLAGINSNFEEVKSRVNKTRKALKNLIHKFNEIGGYPISENMKINIYATSKSLVDPAISFGYCEEATDLLKILANSKLTWNFGRVNLGNDVLRVADAYGKRAILEDKSFKPEIEMIVEEVKGGVYGTVTTNYLSSQNVKDAYEQSVVFEEDGVVLSRKNEKGWTK